MKAYILYLLRWQASTPLLWVIIYWLGTSVWATIIANLIGGAIFFFVDREIFNKRGIMYKVGDKVQISGDAEDCCAAEDAGNVGVVVKVKNPEHIVVKSQAGEWAHCSKCVKHFYD